MLSVKNLIDTNNLTADDINQILDTASSFESINNGRTIKKVPALRGRTIVNLFLEPSTRTKSSFELAEKRLSADSLSMVWEAANAVSIPINGIGGIATWEDAAEMILAGATAVTVGTANLVNPMRVSGIGEKKYTKMEALICV